MWSKCRHKSICQLTLTLILLNIYPVIITKLSKYNLVLKLTWDLHLSVHWNYRACTSLYIPGCPTGIKSLVLQGQVGQVKMWVQATLSHNFNTIFVQDHLLEYRVASDATRHRQNFSNKGRTRWDLQNSPPSWRKNTVKDVTSWCFLYWWSQ